METKCTCSSGFQSGMCQYCYSRWVDVYSKKRIERANEEEEKEIEHTTVEGEDS